MATTFTKGIYSERLANGEKRTYEGYLFSIEGIALAVRKTDDNIWQVSEIKSGMLFGTKEKTRKAAVEQAEKMIEKFGLEKVLETIEKAVKSYGSPQEEEVKEEEPQVEEEEPMQEEEFEELLIDAPKQEEVKEEEPQEEEVKPKKVWNIGQFFKGVDTFDLLKKKFKQFAKWLHPDVSDYENANEAFIELQNQYAQAEKIIKQGKKVEDVQVKVPQDCQDAISKIIDLKDIEIKIRGTWVWVAGVKREDKDKHAVLKAAGFGYGKNANEWFYASKEGGMKRRGKGKGYNADQLTQKWGEEKVKGNMFKKEKLQGQAQ